MDEKDKIISDMRQELAKWRGRAIEAAQEACTICQSHVHPDGDDCRICRIRQLQETK